MLARKLIGVIIAGALCVLAVSCGGDAPVVTGQSASNYKLVSEQHDPATGSLVIDVKVPMGDQAVVKSVAESLINSRKALYQSITVNTYVENVSASDRPFGVSKLEGGTVSHHFNQDASQQRIPPH